MFIGRTNEHGTKTIYMRTSAGAANRFDATIAAIAEALKALGDTSTVDHRRADAVDVIADPRFTEELLLQARNQHPDDTTPEQTDLDPRTAAPDETQAPHTGSAPDETAETTSADAQTGNTSGGRDTTRGDTTRRDTTRTARGDTVEPAAKPTAPNRRIAPGNKPSTEPGGQPCPPRPATATPATVPTPAQTTGGGFSDDDLLADSISTRQEPGPDDEADRDAPHPSDSNLPDPLDAPFTEPSDPTRPSSHTTPDPGEPLTPNARRALHARLAAIKHKAHTNPSNRADTDRPGRRLRPGKTEIYVHLTDHTLATGTGVLRAEGIGPLLASQLTELVGHGPYTVKPVIDLNDDATSVDAYEIPDRIRERIKLTHPVELFPYGNRETNQTIDLDHIHPYDPLGPPGQTNTANLAPLGRFSHRVKTHAHGWNVQRVDYKTLEWTTPHGFAFHVTPTGTRRVPKPGRDTAEPP